MNVITNDLEKCTEALDALHEVVDPEIGLNVVDLGLIYQLDFDSEEKKIYCSMTLTTQFCPMGGSIVEGVNATLQNHFGDYGVEVGLRFDPPWNYERITEQGKEFLSR